MGQVAAAVGVGVAGGEGGLVERVLIGEDLAGLFAVELADPVSDQHRGDGAREGLLLIDADGRVQLANDEAQRLLGLARIAPGTPVGEVGLPGTVAELLAAGRTAYDELHLGATGVVVVNQIPARTEGGARAGQIVTLRDHTQLQRLLGELDAVRSLAESLQAQNHEAANRLHTVVSLIEIGRPDRAASSPFRSYSSPRR